MAYNQDRSRGGGGRGDQRGSRGRGGDRGGDRQRTPSRQTLPESYDLYVRYPTETEDDVRRIIGNHPKAYNELESTHTRISLLATSLVERTKEFSKSGHRKFGGGYPNLLHNKRGVNEYTKTIIQPALEQLKMLEMYPPKVDVNTLPLLSFFIQFRFTLTRPFYSRDDDQFYIHENPVMKENVFKVPMVRPSSWKGTLRGTATKVAAKYPKLVNELFGYARGDDDSEDPGQRSRLIFYPTFFDAIDLDMINPHSRRTKAGTVPITLEVVPPGATGYFTLVYVPFNLIGLGEKVIRTRLAGDMLITVQTIERTMCRYGFSAKRNRGYGLVDQQLPARTKSEPSGQLHLKGEPLHTFRSFSELNKIAGQLIKKISRQ
ncbi:hypothetical protein QUF58_00630 [Anaerolineales bacterium HSG24]|nr:hypothetical protein [Anaerolineales bacterium HSG24]